MQEKRVETPQGVCRCEIRTLPAYEKPRLLGGDIYFVNFNDKEFKISTNINKYFLCFFTYQEKRRMLVCKKTLLNLVHLVLEQC